jgi:hypothetical protein
MLVIQWWIIRDEGTAFVYTSGDCGEGRFAPRSPCECGELEIKSSNAVQVKNREAREADVSEQVWMAPAGMMEGNDWL